MRTLRDPIQRHNLVQRLQRLTPESKPKWGRLDAPRVICHLIDSLSLALGYISIPSMNFRTLRHFPLKHLILYVFPFPRGARSASQLFLSKPGTFEGDSRRLRDLMEELAAAPRSNGPAHPLFGILNKEEWNALQAKHIDHHLRQFGC